MRLNQSLGIISLVFLVLLAGCSGLPVIGDNPDTTPQENNTSEIDYPYGWNESGIEPYVTKKDNPMLSESSLTFEFERTIELTDSNGEYTVQSQTKQIHKVSGLQQNWYISVERQNSLSQYYFTGGEEYARTAVLYENGSVRSQSFGSERRSFERVEAYQIKGPELLIVTTDWDDTEKATYEGKEAIKYTASGRNSILQQNPVLDLGPESGIEDYKAVLYIDKESGYILNLQVTVEGNRADDAFRGNFEFKFSNFSDTDVPNPDWAQRMKNNSTAQPPFNNSTFEG